MIRSRVRSTLVSQRDSTSGFGTRREAAFVLGDTVFTISFDMKPDLRTALPDFEHVLATAVAKAAARA